MRTDENLIDAYLLGELEPAEQLAVEDRMFVDEPFFDRVEFHEDELIDAYIEARLSPTQRRRFEENFLVSVRRKHRLALVQALEIHFQAEARAIARVPWWTQVKDAFRMRSPYRGLAYAACTAVLVLAGLSSWLTSRLFEERSLAARHRDEAQQRIEQLQQEAQRREMTGRQQARESVASPPQERVRMLAFALSPGFMRGSSADAGRQVLTIAAEAESVQLKLESRVAISAGTYEIAIKAAGGDVIWRKEQVIAKGSSGPLTANVPARYLPRGLYQVATTALEPDGSREPLDDYEFEVKR